MKKESYSKLALNAMRRASKKAIEKAANMDLEIPEWKGPSERKSFGGT